MTLKAMLIRFGSYNDSKLWLLVLGITKEIQMFFEIVSP